MQTVAHLYALTKSGSNNINPFFGRKYTERDCLQFHDLFYVNGHKANPCSNLKVIYSSTFKTIQLS